MSQLKQALGNHQQAQDNPPELADDFEWITIPDEVFAFNANHSEVLTSWKGSLNIKRHRKEYVEDFKCQFSDFNLEDKVSEQLGGIVRPPIVEVYAKKGRKGNVQNG